MIEKLLLLENRYRIREDYRRAGKRLLLLDYDGTLVNIARVPGEAKPDRLAHHLLNSLVNDTKNIVALVSGRDKETLERWFKNEKLIYGAEHGALLKFAGEKNWQPIAEFNTEWKPAVKTVMEHLTKLHAGSFIEEKEYSLVWHYRLCQFKNEPKELALAYEALVQPGSADKAGIKRGKKNFEVACPSVNKGIATKMLLQTYKPDFALAIGDDTTDEDMFLQLQHNSHYSIRVGIENTTARFCVLNPSFVLSFLKFLTS